MSAGPAPLRLQALAHPLFGPLDLEVQAGEVVALLGRNGVGKSTLLRCVAGLAPPAHGAAAVRAPIALVPQDYRASLFPWLSTVDNAALLLAGRGLPAADRRHRARAALAAFDVAPALHARPVLRLSGGEQQRVALARALAALPQVLLLDEPFAALDLVGRARARRAIAGFIAERRAAALVVSHDLDDVLGLADRALVLGGVPARVVADVRVDRREPERLRAALLDACAEAA